MALVIKNLLPMQEFDPWVGKMPWSRKWQPATVFLLKKFMDRDWQITVNALQRMRLQNSGNML